MRKITVTVSDADSCVVLDTIEIEVGDNVDRLEVKQVTVGKAIVLGDELAIGLPSK